MFRSGFFLSVSGPAAILTLMVHPTVRETADQWRPSVSIESSAGSSDARAISALSHGRVAFIPSAPARTRVMPPSAGQTASDKEMPRMRKPLQEGCERSISSLAGPEARRMLPGRCMT